MGFLEHPVVDCTVHLDGNWHTSNALMLRLSSLNGGWDDEEKVKVFPFLFF